jgi:hypothetical protein
MWNKIYLIALAVLITPMAFLTYYAWSWLQSIGAPRAVVESYDYWSNLNWNYLWISTVILLILANVLLWKTRRAWALWTTFLYFAIFIVVRYFWLDQTFFQYKQTNGALQNGFSLQPLLGAALIAVAAVIVFFDQFLVKRLHDKTYPATETPATNTAIIENDSEKINGGHNNT